MSQSAPSCGPSHDGGAAAPSVSADAEDMMRERREYIRGFVPEDGEYIPDSGPVTRGQTQMHSAGVCPHARLRRRGLTGDHELVSYAAYQTALNEGNYHVDTRQRNDGLPPPKRTRIVRGNPCTFYGSENIILR